MGALEGRLGRRVGQFTPPQRAVGAEVSEERDGYWAREAAKLQAAWAHGHDQLTDGCSLCQGEWAAAMELSASMRRWYCLHCGEEVEDRGDPCMSGARRSRWVHVGWGGAYCYPQRVRSPRAEPER